MTSQPVKKCFDLLPEDIKNFECDAIVFIAVKRIEGGNWQPTVMSLADGFTPEDLARMCLFAAEDILTRAGVKLPPRPDAPPKPLIQH